MDKSIEETITQLRKTTDQIEARLATQEAGLAISAAKVDKDFIEKVQEATWKQVKRRWDFVQGFLVVLTIVLTVIGAIIAIIAIVSSYNFYESRKIVDDIKNQAVETKKSIDAASENTKIYTYLLGINSLATVLMSEAYREAERKEFSEARRLATQAIDVLDDTFTKANTSIAGMMSTYTLNSDTCTLDPPTGASLTPCDAISIKGIELGQLYPAICRSYFYATDLRAQATFNLPAKTTSRSFVASELRRDGKVLVWLDRSRTEGYHWVGIGEVVVQHFDEARECFKVSSHQTRGTSAEKDFVNLAEVAFVTGSYIESANYAKSYLSPRGLLKEMTFETATPIEIIANFYLSLADFVLSRDAEAPQRFRASYGSLKFDPLGVTFSSEALDNFLTERDSPFQHLSWDKRQEVMRTASPNYS
jgi:cell division protein FtsL